MISITIIIITSDMFATGESASCCFMCAVHGYYSCLYHVCLLLAIRMIIIIIIILVMTLTHTNMVLLLISCVMYCHVIFWVGAISSISINITINISLDYRFYYYYYFYYYQYYIILLLLLTFDRPLGIYYRGVPSEGGAVDWGSIV